MIALGYPGEVSDSNGTRILFGLLSTIPFLYLLYVLFVELSKSIVRQPPEVEHTISTLRLALVGLWGVYPIAYMFPIFGLAVASSAKPTIRRDGGRLRAVDLGWVACAGS